jgi:hypothetical protein
MGSFDDSTGKQKYADTRQRSKVLLAIFSVGFTLGIILSERVYINANREDILKGTALANKVSNLQSSQSAATSGTSAAAASAATSATAAAAIKKDPQLKALKAYLQKVAPNKEVLIGVSNMNPLREGMLGTFLEGVKQAKVENYVIVALDEETTKELEKQNINVFHMPIEISQSQKDTGSNHAVSALKFGIIKKFLMLGWAVLLSDIDICVLQDPFKHLYRWEGWGRGRSRHRLGGMQRAVLNTRGLQGDDRVKV